MWHLKWDPKNGKQKTPSEKVASKKIGKIGNKKAKSKDDIKKKMQGPKNETQKNPSEKLAPLKKWWGPKNRKQKGELNGNDTWTKWLGPQKWETKNSTWKSGIRWICQLKTGHFFVFFLAVAGSQVRMRHLQVLESRVTRWKGKLHFFFGTFYSGRLPSENARISRWTFYFAIDPNETVTLASKNATKKQYVCPFFLWWAAEVTKGYGKQVPSMTVCRWISLVQATSCHTCSWQSQLSTWPSLTCFSGKFAAEAAHSLRARGWSFWSAYSRWELPQPCEAVPQGQILRCIGVHWAAIWHSVSYIYAYMYLGIYIYIYM